MSKRGRGCIDWNRLSVAEITAIITHFAAAEAAYHTMTDTHFAATQLPVVRSRQAFWSAMRERVARGESIASQVQSHIVYERLMEPV